MEIQKTLLPNLYELPTGVQSFTDECTTTNRQLDWLETSLGFGKSDKHLRVYDSYMQK